MRFYTGLLALNSQFIILPGYSISTGGLVVQIYDDVHDFSNVPTTRGKKKKDLRVVFNVR